MVGKAFPPVSNYTLKTQFINRPSLLNHSGQSAMKNRDAASTLPGVSMWTPFLP